MTDQKITEIVNDFYSQAPAYRTKARLVELLKIALKETK